MNAHKFKTLDVRPLIAGGVEPLPEIRQRIAALTPGNGLTLIAPFMPAPLIELLRSEGFESTMEHRQDGSWVINFWRD